MDNIERREDMLPMADQGQQINLIVAPPEDGVIVIDLRRVFRNMKNRRRIYAWVMVLCLAVGVCAPLLLYQFNRNPLTVSSVVTLTYDVTQKDEEGEPLLDAQGTNLMMPVKDLTAPDDTELDLNQITSSYVLQSALAGLTLSHPLALTDLRDNIRIERVLTENSRRQQEMLSRMLDDKNAAAYSQAQDIELTYANSFVVSLTNGFGLKAYELTEAELRLVLDRVLSAYNGYLVTAYADLRLPDDEFSAINVDALDLQESLELIRTGVKDLYAFCDSKPDAVKAYRSWRTGRSLKDLMADLETLRTVSVDYLYSYVFSNSIVRDRNALITTYQYQLRNAQTQLDVLNQHIATNQKILKNYKNDEVFVSMQESDTTKSTKSTTDYYNDLILEQADNYDRVAELETRVMDLTDKLGRLTDRDASASSDPEQVSEELANVLSTCRRAYDEIRDHVDELLQSASFSTYAFHSVPQGKAESFLGANVNKMVIGAVAGLFVACGLWLLDGIAPEFRLKKDETIESKEVASR